MNQAKSTGHGMLDGDRLLEALDSPALIVDGDGVILQLNRAARSFCDRAGRPIVCGAPVSELLPEIHAYWPKGLQSFDTDHGVECVPLDEPVRVRGTPLCNVQGSAAGWLLLLQVSGDIEGRSEQRLRSLLSSMDDLVIVLDPDGRIVEYHQPADENLAPSNGWMLGKYYQEIFPDPAARKFAEMMEIVIETGATHRFDQLVVVDGEERWYSANMGLLRDDDGDVSGFLVVARNITQRKRIETAEREQRVLAEALQDVALALNSTLNLEEIWERILANIVRVVPADAAAILLVDENQARVVGERGYSERDAGVVGHEIELNSLTRLRHMMETRRPYLIADARAAASWTRQGKNIDKDSSENRRRQWARSYVGAPILLDDEVIGFLKLESAVANYFTPTDAERLRAFAGHAGVGHPQRAAVRPGARAGRLRRAPAPRPRSA